MAPPYIVDCLHIWPLPRGRIYLRWHQCILAVRSFWFEKKKDKNLNVFLEFQFDLIYSRKDARLLEKHLKISQDLWLRASRLSTWPNRAVLFFWSYLSLAKILWNSLAFSSPTGCDTFKTSLCLLLNLMAAYYWRVIFEKDKIGDCKDLVFMGQDLNSWSGGVKWPFNALIRRGAKRHKIMVEI